MKRMTVLFILFGLLTVSCVAAERAVDTPDEALAELKDGNLRFLKKEFRNTGNFMAQIENTSEGQKPHTVILSCLDSRIPPEIVFDQGIGNIFVARVAGNVADPNILGSMEFATHVVGSKLIVVMGHNHCGAVQGAIAGVELGNLTQLLAQIRSASVSAANPEDEDEVGKRNVQNVISYIQGNSPVIASLVAEGALKVVGAYYDVQSGQVAFFEKFP